MHRTALLKLILVTAMSVPVFAQAQQSTPPARIRGTVEKFDDHTLAVKSPGGNTVAVTLAPDFAVRAVVAEPLADIKPGEKVGITSIKGSGGGREAVEIHVFPRSMSNVRLLELPWDRGPDSLMTNATVAEVSEAAQGRMIKVMLNGKVSEIAVPPGTPIVTYAPGDVSLLKPGATVFVIARKQPDGNLTAAGVTAEKNGVKPPM